MLIFIARGGERLGAWTPDEVSHHFQAGQLIGSDHYWREGMTHWDMLGKLFSPTLQAPAGREDSNDSAPAEPEKAPGKTAPVDATESSAEAKTTPLPDRPAEQTGQSSATASQETDLATNEPRSSQLELLDLPQHMQISAEGKASSEPPGTASLLDAPARTAKPIPALPDGPTESTVLPMAKKAAAVESTPPAVPSSAWVETPEILPVTSVGPEPSIAPADPEIPISSQRSRSRFDFFVAWFLPLALIGIASVAIVSFFRDALPGLQPAGQMAGVALILIVAAFPISFFFPRRLRVFLRCALVLLAAGFVCAALQHRLVPEWMAEVKTFTRREQSEQRRQIAKGGAPQVDPQKVRTEIRKLDDISKHEDAADRRLTDVAVDLLKDVSARSEDCREAEKPMLQLGLGPSKLTSLDELDKRRAAVQAAQPPIESFVTYLQNVDTMVHDKLIAQGVAASVADEYVNGMERSGKEKVLLTYWQQEGAISGDLLANLDVLKRNWGEWHMDGEKVIFTSSDALADYRGNLDKLKNDIAIQKAAQEKVLAPAP